MKKYYNNWACIFIAGSIIALCVLFYTAHNAHADGEIILYPGEKYTIPCLNQLLSGQEYDIEIENPDIVGLDETGKCIVAVAPGTTEVTVRLINPDAGYVYVFAVADVFGQPAAGIYDEPGEIYAYDLYTDGMAEDEWTPENNPESHKYDGAGSSNQTDATVRPYKEPGADEEHGEDVGTEQGAVTDTERNAGYSTEQAQGNDTEKGSDTGTEKSAGYDAAAGDENMSWNAEGDKSETTEQNHPTDDIEKAAGEAGNVPKDTEHLSYPPVYFTHGTGKYDTIVPPHYTLWICAHSRGPVSVLYVGVNGAPIRYRFVKKLICICSDDLPSGNCRIQVIVADAAGRVTVMKEYGVAKSEDFSNKFIMLNHGK